MPTSMRLAAVRCGFFDIIPILHLWLAGCCWMYADMWAGLLTSTLMRPQIGVVLFSKRRD